MKDTFEVSFRAF